MRLLQLVYSSSKQSFIYMSKLPQAHQFVDLSDYGRPIARVIANSLKETRFTPVHVTISFVISGLIAIYCILTGQYFLAAFFLILKSILDAADGELARVKNKPSYIGRYLDSTADILLNALFITAIGYVTQAELWMCLLAFVGLQLQGTLYNYYYVILRNKLDGDKTSRVIENKAPKAFKGEKQQHVNFLFNLYNLLYISFDKTIYMLDEQAEQGKIFPKWFMTSLSTMGLGFQLLIMAVLLVLGFDTLIIPFFFAYTLAVLLFVAIRRLYY